MGPCFIRSKVSRGPRHFELWHAARTVTVASAAPVPLIILTGFLGAGKTTVLNRVLGSQHRRRVAVLVNELGRIDIDAGLIRGRAGDVLELSGGCVCHAIGVQRELWSALEDVVRRSRPDIAILETTGLAEPDAILRGLEQLAANAPDGKGPVRAAAVVTVVDAEAGLAQLDRHEEARDQVRAADRILLSKLDRAGAERNLIELHRRLHDLNSSAERAAFGTDDAGTAALIAWLLEPAPRRSARPGHAHALAISWRPPPSSMMYRWRARRCCWSARRWATGWCGPRGSSTSPANHAAASWNAPGPGPRCRSASPGVTSDR